MAFEPLQTDEKLAGPVKKPRDMDAAMLFGCSGFVATSIIGYILSVWPYIVFQNSEQISGLVLCSAFGLIPAAILGVFATRKFALAGACGFVGGAMATAIFLYLRIEQAFIGALARQAPKPEYPAILQYLVPIGWVIVAAILAVIALPPERMDD